MPLHPSIVGAARLGNFRLGSAPAALTAVRRTRARTTVAGVAVIPRTITIHDALNDQPNTCQLTLGAALTPVVDQRVRVTVNSDAPRLLFSGTLQSTDLTFEAQPSDSVWACTAVDDLVRLNRRVPIGSWTNVSVTTIAQALIATFGPGFTAKGVQVGLPLASVNFDGSEGFSGCLSQLAKLIGGYYYVEDLDLHLFQTEATDPPDPIDGTHPEFEDDPPITLSTNTSRLMTRVYGKGHAEATMSEVAAGETIVPVSNAGAWFGTVSPGGKVISETQVLDYTGVQPGGGGTVVGPSVAPVLAPSATPIVGAGVELGPHDYAYLFGTAAGRSLPSPLGRATCRLGLTAPTGAPGYSVSGPGASTFNIGNPGDTVAYTYSYGQAPLSTDLSAESAVSPSTGAQTLVLDPVNGGVQIPALLVTYSTDPLVKWIHLWISQNGGTFHRSVSTVANISSGGTTSMDGGATVTATVVPSSGALQQVALSAIAIGPTGTTYREIYRTPIGSAQLKLQQTISNNTSTVGVTDATADASLGANAPTSDTSGLSTVVGSVPAGATSILTAGAGPFFATGGWAINGRQIIRYAGITGNTLTGIPSTGLGSILSTIAYGEHLDPAPALTGIAGLTRALANGAPVNILVQRDDLAAQAAAAIRESTATDPSNGVHEYRLTDERRNEASLIALCDAHLTLFSSPIKTVPYATRDVKSKSGKPTVVTLANPPITVTLTIQDVVITEIDTADGLAPKFTVMASSVRFSIEDLLQGA